jgi:DNA-binding response OmpR family regulator
MLKQNTAQQEIEPMRALVVEDEDRIAQFVKRGLEETGFEVDLRGDGEEGLEAALTGTYGLIVLDIMMPKMDGLEMIQKLRTTGSNTPVIMLTAKSALEDIIAGLDAGADDYLPKPFAMEELNARVRSLLRREGKARGAEIEYHDLRVDPVTHRVWRGESEIELTNKEYGMLEYLLRHKEQIVTRDEIAENAWEFGTATFSNIIDVYVNYLRKKIDKGFKTKLIHTVRGQGYAIMART